MQIKSVRGKVFFFYLILFLINASFFSVIIYENQIELIVENTILRQKEVSNKIAENIHLISFNKSGGQSESFNDDLDRAAELISRSISSFMIATTDGKILRNNGYREKISESDISNSVQAMTARNFSGDLYFSHIDMEKKNIIFYIPVLSRFNCDAVLIFSRDLQVINNSMASLYKQIGAVILLIALFHIALGFLFFKILVNPISDLHKQSRLIASGKYDARADVKSSDEIGELAEAFNTMAGSIENKIDMLEEYKADMEYELRMAEQVQKLIFPVLSDDERFSFSLFSSPYSRVSGDYYDCFDLDNGSLALLIADISGHGVPAALMTMTVKENFEKYAQTMAEPSEVFKLLNSKMCEMFSDENMPPRYLSGFYIIIDKNNLATYCNAGHPDPLLISVQSDEIKNLSSEGGLVGVFEDMDSSYSSEKSKIKSKRSRTRLG